YACDSGGKDCHDEWAPGGSSDGPLVAQTHACQDAIAALPVQKANDIAALWDSILALMSHAQLLQSAVNSLATDGADIRFALESGKRAKAQADLEAQLLQSTQQTSFNIYRQYHDYDLFRAKAMIEDARRYAAAARRAIEARFVVDLSSMTA